MLLDPLEEKFDLPYLSNYYYLSTYRISFDFMLFFPSDIAFYLSITVNTQYKKVRGEYGENPN